MEPTPLKADLVLEGGGAKCLALIGALSVLEEAGYTFPRVAGSSSGALVGALVAAGIPAEQMRETMIRTPFRTFQDGSIIDRLGALGRAASLLVEQGIYEGDCLRDFLREHLPEKMQTFAGLRLPPDPESDLAGARRYRLMVLATDVSQHQLVRLPWDYSARYHLDRDEQSVIDAVRASMSIPFFFEPIHLKYTRVDEQGHHHHEEATLADGGLLSDFPVDAFDRTDGRPPRWPTFGIKLSGMPGRLPKPTHLDGPLTVGLSMVEDLVAWRDRAHIDDPAITERTIFVESSDVASFNFGLLKKDQDYLYESGREAATRFLKNWNFEEHKDRRAVSA